LLYLESAKEFHAQPHCVLLEVSPLTIWA